MSSQYEDEKAAYNVRAAALAAGFPNTTGASSVNRFCASGLKSTHDIANQIAMGAMCKIELQFDWLTHWGAAGVEHP